MLLMLKDNYVLLRQGLFCTIPLLISNLFLHYNGWPALLDGHALLVTLHLHCNYDHLCILLCCYVENKLSLKIQRYTHPYGQRGSTNLLYGGLGSSLIRFYKVAKLSLLI